MISHTASSLIAQYAQQAQASLPADIWQYLQTDAGNGQQRRANHDGWQSLTLTPRPLTNMTGAHTRLNLFGAALAHPIMLAPVAYQKLFHADGEAGSAVACNAQGGQMLVSSLASQPLEHIIQQAQQPLWFQLYWQGDRARTLRLLQRAEAAGYTVIVLTVDAPVKPAVMDLPAGIHAVNLEQPLAALPLQAGQSLVFDGWMAQAPTWQDVVWLRAQTTLPLLIKGLLHVQDVLQAVQLGCDGVVVSNHGGRVLDGTPTVAQVLPAIVQAVQGKARIIVDSGITSGQHVFKALAMGADAVCIGRPYIYGLASEGAMGVARVLRMLRDELEMTMALTGVTDLAAIRQVPLI